LKTIECDGVRAADRVGVRHGLPQGVLARIVGIAHDEVDDLHGADVRGEIDSPREARAALIGRKSDGIRSVVDCFAVCRGHVRERRAAVVLQRAQQRIDADVCVRK
jgi:hypothetical protein